MQCSQIRILNIVKIWFSTKWYMIQFIPDNDASMLSNRNLQTDPKMYKKCKGPKRCKKKKIEKKEQTWFSHYLTLNYKVTVIKRIINITIKL